MENVGFFLGSAKNASLVKEFNMANIFQRIFGQKETETVKVQEERSILSGLGLEYNSISSYSNSLAMKLSTAYACTNILSNSVALLPIKIVSYKGGKKSEIEHPLNKILNLSPNQKYNRYNFFKLLIESLILNGNGYAYIVRDEKLNVVALELLDPSFVTPLPQANGTVKYLVAGMDSAVDAMNMIHLYQHVDNAMNGISVIKYADMTLRAAFDTEKMSNNFYKRGAGLLGVLKASAPLTEAQKTQIAQSWEKSVTRTEAGGVAILPQGLDFQSISVSPEDAQLLSSKAYDTIQICRFFNVSPLKVFDYSHMSYSSLEQVSMSYLQDSVLPYTQLIEDEFNRKIFRPSEIGKIYIDFDYTALIGTDKKTEAEYFRTLITNGLCTVNEARVKLGFAPLDGDEYNETFLQLSYGTVKNISEGMYVKQNAQDASGNLKVDNNAKEKENKTENTDEQ